MGGDLAVPGRSVEIEGQLAFPDLIPDSFWAITQDHCIIPDGIRFLVVEDYRDDWWLAWENGIKPLNLGTLLKEEHFHRE